jgi:hypothetical protein
MQMMRSQRIMMLMLALCIAAAWMYFCLLPQDPNASLPKSHIGFVGFQNMRFGHDSFFYLKDDDTGKVTLSGDVYHCGPIEIDFTRHYGRQRHDLNPLWDSMSGTIWKRTEWKSLGN